MQSLSHPQLATPTPSLQSKNFKYLFDSRESVGWGWGRARVPPHVPCCYLPLRLSIFITSQ